LRSISYRQFLCAYHRDWVRHGQTFARYSSSDHGDPAQRRSQNNSRKNAQKAQKGRENSTADGRRFTQIWVWASITVLIDWKPFSGNWVFCSPRGIRQWKIICVNPRSSAVKVFILSFCAFCAFSRL
jgi:hypothetical protein